MRRDFFLPDGDTTLRLAYLKASTRHFVSHTLDIRNRQAMCDLISQYQPNLIISDLHRFKSDYPNWNISRSLDDIFIELAKGVKERELNNMCISPRENHIAAPFVLQMHKLFNYHS